MTPARARWAIGTLLRICRLGDRRTDVEADVTELFDTRVQQRGRLYASWRLCVDVVSLVVPGRRQRDPSPLDARASRTSGWLIDLRYGLRLVAKRPGVIGATVGGLALAIGVATAVFTIVDAGVMRPYGMADPHSVVSVQMLVKNGMATSWPYRAYLGMHERASHARVEAFVREGARLSLSSSDAPSGVDPILFVSGGYLPTLGAHAVLGRTLQSSDDDAGAAPVAVLNHRIWSTRFKSDPQIVGKIVWLSGTPVTVVGVIDLSFTGPVDNPPACWASFRSYAAMYRDKPLERTSDLPVSVIARVETSVSREVAAQELSAIAAALPDLAIRDDNGVAPVTGVRLDGAASPMDGADSTAMLLLVGAMFAVVGLVVVLACVNVANLLLASAAGRAREIGVRLALGASRGRIVRQLLSESALLGLVAGAGGLLLSIWLVPIVAAATGMPETYDLRPDRIVFFFTAAIALLAGMGAGITPARHVARGDLAGVLKSEAAQTGASPTTVRLRRWFIGFQAAGSMLLFVAAALFLRAALHITRMDLGFDADRLVAISASFPRAEQAETAAAYWRAALERVAAMPSVESASLVEDPPFGGMHLRTLPRGSGLYQIYENRADSSYFDTAGFRMLRGRVYSAAEANSDAPVAIVSESIVRDFLGDADPIGVSLAPISDSLAQVRVVGVVAEAMTSRVRGRGNGTIYRPLTPAQMATARLIVRARQPSAIVRGVEAALITVDPQVRPTSTVIRDDVDRYLNDSKVLAGLSSAVAGLALLLSVLGVFGVTTFVTGQRMWEVQVRRAIGASAGDIVRLLLRQSLAPVALGLGCGLMVAIAAARVLTPALSGVSPSDPPAIASALIVLLFAAFGAVLSPTLRAARANPAAVLRRS